MNSAYSRPNRLNGRSINHGTQRTTAAILLLLLTQRWSSEQIAHGLHQRHPNDPTMRISHEVIYTYLYVLPRGAFKRELTRYLDRRHRSRHPHKLHRSSRPVQGSASIGEWPAEVATRTVPKHWKGDLLVGHANASVLGTLIERTLGLRC